MYTKLTWQKNGNTQLLKMAEQTIFEIVDERWFRFRTRGNDMRWIGSDFAGIDAGWGFYDAYLAGYVPDKVIFRDHPKEGRFQITLEGHKENLVCENVVELEGIWQEEGECFCYELSMYLNCKLEDLYQTSLLCKKSYAADPQARPTIRVLDFFPAYSCYQNLNQCITDAEAPRPLYQWHIMREKDGEWVKAPKVHIPDLRVREGVGKYKHLIENEETSLTLFPVKYGNVGSVFGIADHAYGGWLVEVLETPGPIMHSVCWYSYDIHVDATHAVPPRGSCEDVSMKFRCRFSPIDSKQANRIVAQAREYHWRNQDFYDVPIRGYENHFERSLKDLPGEETAHLNFWQASDENCHMDVSMGCSAPGSICIARKTDKPMPSAWWAGNWGLPFDDRQIIGRRLRFSGMVKCENVTGRARLGVASTNGLDGELFYGHMTHFADGMVRSSGGSIGGKDAASGCKDIRWIFSDSVTASADWTRISLEFDVYGVNNTLFMEMSGTGTCWFDDVMVEDIGPMRWKDVILSEKSATEGLERYWARHKALTNE